jgi:hypothetical protein
LPQSLRPRHISYGLVFEMDDKGTVLRSLHDPTGKRVRDVSGMFEKDGVLYVGSLSGTHIARVNLL